jgi:hypothetical protein
MQRATTTIAAYDLGKVEGPNVGWRSFAFDLTAVHGAIESGAVRLDASSAGAGDLRFGEGGGDDLNLAARPTARHGAANLQFRLNEEALNLANLAAGGFMYLDVWVQTPGGSEPVVLDDLWLEVSAVARAQELAA